MQTSDQIAEMLSGYGVSHFFFVPVILPETLKRMSERGILPVRERVKYGETRWKAPAEVLGRTGMRPDDIGALLLTHDHVDHAGCAGEFAAAHVYIQREEIDRYRAALRLPPRFEFLTRNCQPELLDVLGERDRNGLLTLADGQHAVADHISLLPAFDTHTAGSQFVLVEDEASGPWLFAGDNVYVYENIEGLRGEGAYAPISMATGSPSTWLAVTDDVLRSVGGATQRVLVRFHRPGRGSQRGDHDGRRRTW